MKIIDVKSIPLLGCTHDTGWPGGTDPNEQMNTLIEIGEPLRIDEGLQDAPDFKPVVRAAQPAQKPHIHDVIDIGADAVVQPRLVGGVGEKHAHHLQDVVATKDKALFPARSVELRELLSQERQHEADLVAKLPAGNKPRHFGRPLLGRPLPKVGKALGFIEHEVETDTGDVIANARLNADQRLPQNRIAFAVSDAFHQRDDGD